MVALKVIRADAYADAGAAARFHAEAAAAARLQHPNIVQLFQVGENDGLGYIVLEYVAGEGLDRKLSGTMQAPRESSHTDPGRLAAVGDAFIALHAEHPDDQVDLARHVAVFVADLDSHLQSPPGALEPQSVRDRCAARGVELLRQAVELGFLDDAALESAELCPLLKCAGYQSVELVRKSSSDALVPSVKVWE